MWCADSRGLRLKGGLESVSFCRTGRLASNPSCLPLQSTLLPPLRRAPLPSLIRVQVVLTLAGVAAFAMSAANMAGPSAIILGGALAMSSTAVGIQVLEDRGEMGSRHGRAIFSVLLLQVRISGERRRVLRRWGRGDV